MTADDLCYEGTETARGGWVPERDHSTHGELHQVYGGGWVVFCTSVGVPV